MLSEEVESSDEATLVRWYQSIEEIPPSRPRPNDGDDVLSAEDQPDLGAAVQELTDDAGTLLQREVDEVAFRLGAKLEAMTMSLYFFQPKGSHRRVLHKAENYERWCRKWLRSGDSDA